MRVKGRKSTVLALASYLLAMFTSALFHDHHESHEEDQPTAGFSAAHSEHEHDCSICQFLAQKPAPVAEVASLDASTLVQDVAVPSPMCGMGGVFAAWHSRAPPAFA